MKAAFKDHASPAWLDDGLVIAGGWEPWPHWARLNSARGGDSYERYVQRHSAEFARALARQGITLFITQYWKGLGPKATERDMKLARALISYLHAEGIRAGVYIGDTAFFDFMREELPECESFAMRDQDGRPIRYQDQEHRYRACKNNPEWRALTKQFLRRAIVDDEVDLIHFDNVQGDARACYCPHCVEGFQRYVLERYPDPEQRYRILGYAGDFRMEPWRHPGRVPPDYVPDLYRPSGRLWMDYRAEAMAAAMKDLADYCRAMNPDVAVEYNPTGVRGANSVFHQAVDHNRLLRSSDVFWSEEPPPRCDETGLWETGIRSLKLSKAAENRPLLYTGLRGNEAPNADGSDNAVALRMAQSMAFGWDSLGCAGVTIADSVMIPERGRRYIAFYKEHRDLFRRPRSGAEVGLWRSSRTLAYNSADPHLSAAWWEQALIRRHIPFALLLDHHLGDLDRYNTLIIPNSEVMSDGEMELVAAFVERGGGLVVSGKAALRDEHALRRRDFDGYPLWSELVPVPAQPAYREVAFGQGRAAYVPCVEPPPGREESDVREIYATAGKHRWGVPGNIDTLLRALRYVSPEGLQLQLEGADSVAVELVRNRQDQLLVHLVNYDSSAPPGVVRLDLKCPRNFTPSAACVVSPDREKALDIEAPLNSERVRLEWKAGPVYDVIILTGER